MGVPSPLVFSTFADVADRWVTVFASGEIDALSVPLLEAEFARALGRRRESVVADFADVTFCGSAGLAALLAFERDCFAAGVRFVLMPSRIVQRAIEMTGLTRLFGRSTADAGERDILGQ
jgi:anti-sigma B factor antagonist